MKRIIAILLLVVFVAGCHRGGCPEGQHYEWTYKDGTPQYYQCVDD